MRHKPNKAKLHAKRRARERYGVSLNRFDIAAMVAMIKNNQATFLRRQSNTRTVYEIPYMDRMWIAVYSTTAGTILTFLTHDQYLAGSPYIMKIGELVGKKEDL